NKTSVLGSNEPLNGVCYPNCEVSKIEKVSVDENTINEFILSKAFESLKKNEKNIDKNNMYQYFIKNSSVSMYSIKVLGDLDVQLIIYKKADGAFSYAIADSKTLESGNKKLALSNLKGQLYYSMEVDKNLKIGNLDFDKTENFRMVFTKNNTSVYYNVAQCFVASVASCDASWSCSLWCFAVGMSGCHAVMLAGCIAQEQ
ncbi:MAG: hypothetical protein HYZ42_11650, partial [Bacteroidetes bacterium]|nr:hypothetical protein [Bacteroidota bacterium]